ncbi:MAG TPA: tripartite tricarboxylate transporter substrate binding protein [Burkholderiales bacterium]|nr:tripartite tricarboxylate transporter substrate binding protein [Burkholderiales bacterium]
MKRRALLLFLLLSLAASAFAQYPARPIRIVVTIPPGGAPDITARLVGQKMSEALGQPVVVENRPGANGNTAADLVAKSPADGYTLLLAADSLIAINPHLYARMPIDTLKELTPVASLVANQFVLSVNPSLPVSSFQEFIEFARKANPPLNYASGGNGSQHQLTMEMLKARAGINLVHVPYRGGAPATTATMAGEVAAMFAGTSTAPQIKAGRLRALAVSGTKRSTAFPELPTIAEFYPGFENSIWLGLFGPAGMPQDVLLRLRAETKKALETSEVREKLHAAGGLEPLITSPEEFSALIRRDHERFGKLIKDVGIKAD